VGLPTVGTPFLGLIIDKEGLIKGASIALSLGFKGKICIHPAHIEILNKIFLLQKKTSK